MKNGDLFSSGPSQKSAHFSAQRHRKDSDCGRILPLPGFFPLPRFGKSNLDSDGMQRQQLEHIIRAAAAITGAEQFVIVGSQSVLGQFPNTPAELLVSIEADLYSLRDPADSDLIDGSIGEASPFHQTFGYYAHGVGSDTAILPSGWRERLVRVCNSNTGGGCGLCLEVHDLATSKLVAGREKDLSFVAGLLRHRLALAGTISQRLAETAIDEAHRHLSVARLQRLSA
jgi:hypothetical protein